MQHVDGHLRLSATDLSNHVGCSHLTQQSLRVAKGEIKAPMRHDIRLEALRERGFAHETAYLDHLEKTLGIKRSVVDTKGSVSDRVEQTRALMAAGAELIVQAALFSDVWNGYADVLIKVATLSDLGPWSYEVIDTKLARETKGATILQLCLYAELVAAVQGVLPARVGVVTPLSMEPEWYRTLDYMAYVRRMKASLMRDVSKPIDTYPEPCELCDVCRWQPECRTVRRQDDHLSLVAGISKSQRKELVTRDIKTVAALAHVPLPLPFRPDRGSAESLVHVREQARVQIAGRATKTPYREVLPVRPERGLCRLPEPSPGDLYFDIEGDRYAGLDGLEYLLGVAYFDHHEWQYRACWGLDVADEKAAFEQFVAFVEARRVLHPGLHIYHFDHYEPSALKRLMGRYATCEDQIDDWLRHNLFVDLHQVVRECVIASVERYGLKEMEAFYGFVRTVPLDEAGNARALLERAIELSQLATLDEKIRPTVEGYNRDDCVSTECLHRWLEELRQEQNDSGAVVPRRLPAVVEVNEDLDARRQRVQRLVSVLVQDIPVDESNRIAAQRARWLLAHCLDYYRREDKVEWWEKYRLMDLDPAEYIYESKALGGLEFVQRLETTARGIPTDRYRFPPQDCLIRKDGSLHTPNGESFGSVVSIDLNHETVDVKKMGRTADVHPSAVFEYTRIDVRVLEGALIRLAEWVEQNAIDGVGSFQAARDLLIRTAPRLTEGTLNVTAASLTSDAQRICRNLDHSILPVQGPPGSGKTYLGGELIVDLVRAGKKVGISANSHKVIRNLLDAVIESADRNGVAVRCAAKPDAKGDLIGTRIGEVNGNDAALTAIQDDCDVLGATKYLWARPEFADTVDVLVVDEASQLSLADALAISGAAKSVVYLGDPMQLERPQKGSHPPGVDVSPLDHLLDGETTIPATQGIFMSETRRLHPSICAYTSEVFYDGKLHSMDGLEHRQLVDCGKFDGAGFHLVPITHDGNQSSSTEEADAITALLATLLKGRWANERGEVAPLTNQDVLIVTPYNAQVALLSERSPNARVGTVDKFQGQEAPVVIYSMATSSSEEAPHGMEFLHSANRLNVATSRARCVVIVVASPKLLEVECKTPRQMRLMNALCRLFELARSVA